MFYDIIAAINIVVANCVEFVTNENMFKKKAKKWDFKDYIILEVFRNKTTNRHEINRYAKSFENRFKKHVKRQNFCQRRVYIKPEAWKRLNVEYLKNINVAKSKLAKTFKGFRLYAGDGSDFDLPDTERIRKEFNVKVNFLKKNPAQAKFSSIMDVLNGYLLDGIIGDFRQSKEV